MAGFPRYPIVAVALMAVLYQFVISPLLWTTLGFGRKIEQIDAFNFTCSRVEGVGLSACEDMWLHEPSGLLYLACGNTEGRTKWLPSVGALDVSGRAKKDRIAILDTRASGPVASRLRWTTTIGYVDAEGGNTLDLHGLDVLVGPGDEPMLKILLNNHRPYVDPLTLAPLEATKLGANSTLEVFSAKLGDTVLRHVKTYADEVIETPNRVQWINSNSFVWTNDRSSKVGLRRELDPLLGGGSVGYCNKGNCKIAAIGGFNYPNGLVKGHDNLIYVPSSTTGRIEVLSLQPDNTLKNLHTIRLPAPIDNLSVDSKGDIYAATFPDARAFIQHTKTPYEVSPPATVWRVRKTSDGDAATGREMQFELKKVLEGSREHLPAATIAIYDPRTGRMFVGGPLSNYISICEKR